MNNNQIKQKRDVSQSATNSVLKPHPKPILIITTLRMTIGASNRGISKDKFMKNSKPNEIFKHPDVSKHGESFVTSS